ncbi:hypothetical protein Q4566_04740 [Tamlana sp. 2_MG-2023]|uniref:hypothetical protein n=1 Tax=unclassified Tamlana TaxID=2614803 RepID=UPI0026E14337|nr:MULTISPECIES: hypothetical protein [unclassified Tamlana]MDO6759499.1 hypothetical protein [Tamlana sp. 2_MG-2023]MDO6790362.1 hypothetical protein [Tamlana sp. 1_MG-2023]
MKPNFYIILLIFCFKYALWAQESIAGVTDTTIIHETYTKQLEKPIEIEASMHLINNTNRSLYVFNPPSFQYFQELRTLLNTETDDHMIKAINAYHNSFSENQNHYQALYNACNENQALYKRNITDLELGLKGLESTVDTTQNALLQANTHLDKANEELKTYKKKQFWKNIGKVGAGVVVGVVIGVLVAH